MNKWTKILKLYWIFSTSIVLRSFRKFFAFKLWNYLVTSLCWVVCSTFRIWKRFSSITALLEKNFRKLKTTNSGFSMFSSFLAELSLSYIKVEVISALLNCYYVEAYIIPHMRHRFAFFPDFECFLFPFRAFLWNFQTTDIFYWLCFQMLFSCSCFTYTLCRLSKSFSLWDESFGVQK